MLFQTLFLYHSTAHDINPRIATQLRHKRWSSDSQPSSLNLKYFDVDFSNTGCDPSRIMDMKMAQPLSFLIEATFGLHRYQ
jgi:hypothetical protein